MLIFTTDNSSRLVSSLAGVHPAKCADAAIFSLGNPAADLLALTWVKKRIANRSDPVVICGVALKVLAAAEGLLRAGVEPSRIVLVVNDAVDYIEGINDSQVGLFVYFHVQRGAQCCYLDLLPSFPIGRSCWYFTGVLEEYNR